MFLLLEEPVRAGTAHGRGRGRGGARGRGTRRVRGRGNNARAAAARVQAGPAEAIGMFLLGNTTVVYISKLR